MKKNTTNPESQKTKGEEVQPSTKSQTSNTQSAVVDEATQSSQQKQVSESITKVTNWFRNQEKMEERERDLRSKMRRQNKVQPSSTNTISNNPSTSAAKATKSPQQVQSSKKTEDHVGKAPEKSAGLDRGSNLDNIETIQSTKDERKHTKTPLEITRIRDLRNAYKPKKAPTALDKYLRSLKTSSTNQEVWPSTTQTLDNPSQSPQRRKTRAEYEAEEHAKAQAIRALYNNPKTTKRKGVQPSAKSQTSDTLTTPSTVVAKVESPKAQTTPGSQRGV